MYALLQSTVVMSYNDWALRVSEWMCVFEPGSELPATLLARHAGTHPTNPVQSRHRQPYRRLWLNTLQSHLRRAHALYTSTAARQVATRRCLHGTVFMSSCNTGFNGRFFADNDDVISTCAWKLAVKPAWSTAHPKKKRSKKINE